MANSNLAIAPGLTSNGFLKGRIMHGPLQHVKAIRMVNDSRRAVPRFIEYAYYFYLFYAMIGTALGLSVGNLGGGMVALLTVFCIMLLASRATTVYAPIALPLGCMISYTVLQLFVYGEPLMEGSVRTFIDWIQALIIVHALALRQGFLHRFALAAFVIGLTVMPYLQIAEHASTLDYKRVGAEQGVYLSNANGLASWFGFCTVYFIIVAIETKRGLIRVASGLVAVGCLYVVGMTVSRGALLAVAIATIVALRRLLKRGFLPVLCFAMLSWILYASGLFDRVESFYAARGMEETGRLIVWPLVLERFLNSPLVGVGVSQVTTYISGDPITPHNSFLFIALASGIIPLAFYVAYWWRVAKSALRAHTERTVDAPFCLPLVLYAFLLSLTTNLLMESWLIVTLATVMAAGAPRRARRIIVPPIRRGKAAEHTGSWSEAGHGMARPQRFVPPASS
jgi:O-antigen ligase/polysaccharide polymerase Wzy-like membrane protein